MSDTFKSGTRTNLLNKSPQKWIISYIFDPPLQPPPQFLSPQSKFRAPTFGEGLLRDHPGNTGIMPSKMLTHFSQRVGRSKCPKLTFRQFISDDGENAKYSIILDRFSCWRHQHKPFTVQTSVSDGICLNLCSQIKKIDPTFKDEN